MSSILNNQPAAEQPRKKLPNIDADSQYFSVPVAILVGLPHIKFDIFIQPAQSTRKILYRSALIELPLSDDQRLKERDVRHLFVRIDDKELYDQTVRDTLAQSDVKPELKLALTVKQHQDAFQVALGRNTAVMVSEAEKVANDVIEIVKQDDFAVGRVISLLEHDKCTFQHSCNVAIYAATLAKRSGLSDTDLRLLTTGGMLHDIGKRHVPSYILQKTGKLTDRERELIRQHPTTGFRELATIPQLKWGQLLMAYQHHEWINGTGYPAGITGDEMHLWGKICAIADVFDALTANRPYRGAEQVDRALKIMEEEKGHFDAELFSMWQEAVKS
jgi:putative nucleotidyltransferase with HDIG domain